VLGASAAAVDVGAVVDGDDEDGVLVVIDAQQDPIVAATRASIGSQLSAERLAQPVRVVSQGAGDEFDDRRGDLVWETIEVTPRGSVDFNAVWPVRCVHRGGSPNSSRSVSPLTVDPSAYSRSAWVTSSRILGRESQNTVSCNDSRSSAAMSTAAGRPCLVIVMMSWVDSASSISAESLSFASPSGIDRIGR